MDIPSPTWMGELPSALYAVYADVLSRGTVLCALALSGGAMAFICHSTVQSGMSSHGTRHDRFRQNTFAAAMTLFFSTAPLVLLVLCTQLGALIQIFCGESCNNDNATLERHVSEVVEEHDANWPPIGRLLLLLCTSRLALVAQGLLSSDGRMVPWVLLDVLVCLSACCVGFFLRAPVVQALRVTLLDAQSAGRPLRPWELAAVASQHDRITRWNDVLAAHAVFMLLLQLKRVYTHRPSHCSPGASRSVAAPGSCSNQARSRQSKWTITRADCSMTSDGNGTAVAEVPREKKESCTVGVQFASELLSDVVSEEVTPGSATQSPVATEKPILGQTMGMQSSSSSVDDDEVLGTNVTNLQKVGDEGGISASRISESDVVHASSELKSPCRSSVVGGDALDAPEESDEVAPVEAIRTPSETQDEKRSDRGTGSNKAVSSAQPPRRKLPLHPKPMVPAQPPPPDTHGDLVRDAAIGIAAAAGVMLLLGGTRRLLQRWR